jgi:hypothetical protein
MLHKRVSNTFDKDSTISSSPLLKNLKKSPKSTADLKSNYLFILNRQGLLFLGMPFHIYLARLYQST